VKREQNPERVVVPDCEDPSWPCSGLRRGATRKIVYPPVPLICKRFSLPSTLTLLCTCILFASAITRAQRFLPVWVWQR